MDKSLNVALVLVCCFLVGMFAFGIIKKEKKNEPSPLEEYTCSAEQLKTMEDFLKKCDEAGYFGDYCFKLGHKKYCDKNTK
jgi:hypothetical protein